MKKKKNKCSIASSSSQIDRISHLPNPILSHIVSFLPLQDAIQTRILSKEWRYLCASFSIMEFTDTHFQQEDFKEFVDHTLQFHDGSVIERFKLSAKHIPIPHAFDWISYAIAHNVQRLCIHISLGNLNKLPDCLFTSPTLRVLSMHRVNIKLPTSFRLPFLESILLGAVTFDDQNPLDKLISGCPNLKIFILLVGSWDEQAMGYLSISSPKRLQLLRIYNTCLAHRPMNISSLDIHDIHYTGTPPDISLQTLSSLSNAHFEFLLRSNDQDPYVLSQLASAIFWGLQNVKKLSLCGLFIEYLSSVKDLFAHPVNSWVSLRHLKIEIQCTKNHTCAVIFILESCPNLRSLDIFVKDKIHSDRIFNMEQYMQSHALVVGGTLKHMRGVTFISFEGSEAEQELFCHLLGNAPNLVHMNIMYSQKIQENEARRSNISRKLVMFAKISPSAVISFF